MEQPRGKIISISGNDPERRALVEVDAAAACARCAEGRGCGAGLGSARPATRRVEATIPAGANVSPGDTVVISLAPQSVLAAAAIVYGWPLAGAVAGAGFAYLGAYGDTAAALAALGGLVVGGLLVRRRLARTACLRQFTPRVVA